MSDDATLDDFTETTEEPEPEQDSVRELFGLGEIPSDWSIESLANIAQIIPGNSPPSSTYNENGEGLPFFQGNSEFGHFHPEADTWCSEPRKEAEENDVLMSIRAPVGDLNIADRNCCIGRGLAALRPKTLNGLYLFYNLAERRPWLSRLATGSTFKSVTKGDLQLLDIPVPSLSEQRKIATVLHNVDQAIQKTEETISQLGRVKKGLYQTLFSEGYRKHNQFKSSKYGEIPESWRVLKLAEITSQIQAGGTPDTDEPEYYDGDIPWVKTGELSQYRVTETEQSITDKGFQESTARLFSPGTILIAMYGATTGEVSLLDIEATTNQACCGVVTTEEMKPEFLFHQLNYLSNHLESLSAGSGQQNISKGIIEKFDVLVPTVEEQDSIVRVLNSVDESISENESTKKKYQRLKRGLMQDLLSGTVRTTDTNIEVPDEIAQHG
ncbi:restriction endonuclease subunit S [Halorubrum halophilum]|uniref:restriction endonuclease subunit S n=1 Tax=Halorubrum halophilum TaxID=413816 RepID=UPI00186B011F|nr:restriction endonuclease subunit S [Halorubrum halophilum]